MFVVAVVAVVWAMLQRPYLVRYFPPTRPLVNLGVFPDSVLMAIDELQRNAIPGVVFRLDRHGDGRKVDYAINPRLRAPAALLGLILGCIASLGVITLRSKRQRASYP